MALAAVVTVLWNLYPIYRSVNYSENQIADCIAPLRISKTNIMNTSRTLYGLYIPYDDNMTGIYEALNLIKAEFDEDPVPDIKGTCIILLWSENSIGRCRWMCRLWIRTIRRSDCSAYLKLCQFTINQLINTVNFSSGKKAIFPQENKNGQK
ncbi:hypothetical protein IJT93_00215 [bacterium]|nr:hypothetical protein [bacterium]